MEPNNVQRWQDKYNRHKKTLHMQSFSSEQISPYKGVMFSA